MSKKTNIYSLSQINKNVLDKGYILVLLSSKMEAEEKKKILREDFGIAMTSEMESEASSMCNLSELVERQGIEKGRQEGIKKGIEKGVWNANLEAIKNLMATLKLTAKQAMDALKIPVEEQEKYFAKLK